ncbi:MAG: hypothetical protein ACKO1O_12725 [Erythrobacter sp.]
MSDGGERYAGYGLSIESDFAIPGAVAVPLEGGPPDITVTAGAAQIGPVDAASGPYRLSGASLLLEVPGVARYLARSASALEIAPDPTAAEQDVSALLVATGLPMLLWMRGGAVLHAAGVMMPGAGSAIAIAGASGSGKSRLARACLARGASLLGDDSLLLAGDCDGIVASGLPASLFGPVAGGGARDIHPVPSSQQAGPAPLGAVVVLCAVPAEAPPNLERMSAVEALELLLQHAHRPRIPEILGRRPAMLAALAQCCRHTPVYRLDIPGGRSSITQAWLDAAVDGLNDLFQARE